MPAVSWWRTSASTWGRRRRPAAFRCWATSLSQPLLLLRELVSPPDTTLRYLFNQGLPLMFIPLISFDSWLLMGLPMLGLLLAQGSNNPLSVNYPLFLPGDSRPVRRSHPLVAPAIPG